MDIDEFAKTRGFTGDELEQWDITVEGDVVLIPTLGRAGAWYTREHRPGGSPKYASPKGVDTHLYNPLGLGPNSSEVWLAEGEFDTLSLVTVGAPAVGVLGAGGFRPTWALLYAQARVVVAFDPDSESDEQARRVGQLISLFGERVERFDPRVEGDYGDLNEWFKEDRSGFARAVINF